MTAIFEPPRPVLLLTSDGRRFPLNRIFCIGRNYEAHAREMGRDPAREAPFFFTKWADTLVNAAPEDGARIPYPPETGNFHFEVELVVAVGKPGFRISAASAADHVWGYAVGLDMTRRDLQLSARDQGRPWDIGKNVEASSPVGRLAPREWALSQGFSPRLGAIRLSVGGRVKQDADLSQLIWSVDELIAHLSRFYRLRPGDIVFTGTPAGVGPAAPGDVLTAEIAGLPPLEVKIGSPLDA